MESQLAQPEPCTVTSTSAARTFARLLFRSARLSLRNVVALRHRQVGKRRSTVMPGAPAAEPRLGHGGGAPGCGLHAASGGAGTPALHALDGGARVQAPVGRRQRVAPVYQRLPVEQVPDLADAVLNQDLQPGQGGKREGRRRLEGCHPQTGCQRLQPARVTSSRWRCCEEAGGDRHRGQPTLSTSSPASNCASGGGRLGAQCACIACMASHMPAIQPASCAGAGGGSGG